MTSEINELIEKIRLMPDEEQKELVHLILEELSWDLSFSETSVQLESMANEAIQEYNEGKTKPLKF